MNSTQKEIGKTWSRGTNSHFPLAVNVILNLFIIIQLLIESFDDLNSIKVNVENPDARTRYTTRQGAKKIILQLAIRASCS